jgi:hypothetical protein
MKEKSLAELYRQQKVEFGKYRETQDKINFFSVNTALCLKFSKRLLVEELLNHIATQDGLLFLWFSTCSVTKRHQQCWSSVISLKSAFPRFNSRKIVYG